MKPNSLRTQAALVALGAALLSPQAAHGVAFNFTAVVTQVDDSANLFSGRYSEGTPASGTLWYDSSLELLDGNGNPSVGFYGFAFAQADGFAMSLAIGGDHFAANQTGSGPFSSVIVALTSPHRVEYYSPRLTYNGGTFPGDSTGQSMSLYFADNSNSAVTSDALPTFIPTESMFPDQRRLLLEAWNDSDYSAIRFDITSLTPVPEPGEWAAIAGGGLAAFAAIRRRRLGLVRGGGR